MAPNKPREAPKAINTREKPTTKLMVWSTMRLRSASAGARADAPAMLAIYTGTKGKIQGDRKDRIPATSAVRKVILGIYVSYLLSIAIMSQTQQRRAFATTGYLLQ
jgi:hypothetical protein